MKNMHRFFNWFFLIGSTLVSALLLNTTSFGAGVPIPIIPDTKCRYTVDDLCNSVSGKCFRPVKGGKSISGLDPEPKGNPGETIDLQIGPNPPEKYKVGYCKRTEIGAECFLYFLRRLDHLPVETNVYRDKDGNDLLPPQDVGVVYVCTDPGDDHV